MPVRTPCVPLRIRAACAAAATALVLAACGGDREPADAGDAAAEAAAAGADAAVPATTVGLDGAPEPVLLSERDVEQFIAVMRELNALGDRAAGRFDGDPSRVAAMAQAFRTNAEAMAILRRHGFDDPERFHRVSYSVMSAAVAAQMRDAAPDQAEALRQVEELKGKVPPEEYEAMRRAMQGTVAMMDSMGRQQPEANIQLVARYREQLERMQER